jgi:hypothetical protein
LEFGGLSAAKALARTPFEVIVIGVATKLNPDWDFLCRRRDSGLAKAAEWLDCNFDKVGRSSTVDLAEGLSLGPTPN